jgi:hypothetical protein
MAWRNLGRTRVYRRSERKGTEVRTIYFGSGRVAELAAELDGRRRAERQARSEARKAADARWRALVAQERALDQTLVPFVRASLTAAGYRQHCGGPWRRWRLAHVEYESA